MKKNIIYLAAACLGFMTLSTSCQKEDAPICKEPIVVQQERNAFDEWLYKNYVSAYNIDFKYKQEDIEIDRKFNLVPSTLENSMKMAKIVRYAWLNVYDEVAGKDFMRRLSPRIITLIGSAAWNGNGTITLATAESGLKVVLYRGNWLDPKNVDQLNEMFFHTMHHEFTHILHQNVKWPQEYNTISSGSYAPSSWQNRKKMKEYASLGFVTAYAGSKPVDDIAEVTSGYITFTDEKWAEIWAAAGEEGGEKIKKKIAIVKKYMMDTWHIDLDELKTVARRRLSEVGNLPLIEEDWKPLIDNKLRTVSGVAHQDEFNMINALLRDAKTLDFQGSNATGGERCQIITQYFN